MYEQLEKPKTYYGYHRNEMFKYISQDTRTLLDVGCGEGVFGFFCKEKTGVEVWGIELNVNAAVAAKGKLDQVLIGNIETDELDLPTKYFDCIVFNDVLEHLAYPWAVLKQVRKYLKPNGYVVASIPNIRYYEKVKKFILKQEWEYESEGIMDITHLRFFTMKSIRQMFEEAGYCVSRLEGIRFEEFPWKLNLLNWLVNNRLDDMRYKQIACLARCVEM